MFYGWFKFSAYNSESQYGFGNMAQAETYCQILNSEREINCFSIEEIFDSKLIEELDGGNIGFDLTEELEMLQW